jgi:hypothetical protein
LWGKTFALPFWEPDPSLNALASVIAPNGDIVVAGNRLSEVGYPQKPMLARFTPAGELLWMRIYEDLSGISPLFVPTDLITTSDGNFAMAASDFLDDGNMGHVLKFDNLGNMIWARRFHADGWSMQCRSLVEDSEHRLVMAGGCHALGGWSGFLIARWDLDGAPIDAVSIGDIGMVYPGTAAFQASGQDLMERAGQGYVIAGLSLGRHSLLTLDYNGEPACPGLGSVFPLLIDTVIWGDLPFGNLPGSVSDATSTMFDMDLNVIPMSILDVCPLVTSIVNEKSAAFDLRVWPLPAGDLVTCEWQQHKTGTTHFELIDVCGRTAERRDLNATAGDQRMTWSVADLARGVYYLGMTMDGRTTAQRVVLQ